MNLRQEFLERAPIGNKFTVSRPKGLLSDEGIEAICKSLIEDIQSLWPVAKQRGAAKVPDGYSVTGLGDEQAGLRIGIHMANLAISNVGREAKNKNGSFPKRLSKFVYTKCGVSMSTSGLGKIGSLVNQHSAGSDQYTVDVTDTFRWGKYEFGQTTGSCYWTDSSRSKVREKMEEYGFLAMRMYNDEGVGVSRCWIYPEELRLTLFNCYSSRKDTLLTFGHIISGIMGLPYRKIELHNEGTDSGLLYINSASGVMIASNEHLKDDHDFGLEFREMLTCDRCGCDFNESDAHFFHDNTYCIDCYRETTACCERCGEDICSEDATTTVSGTTYCQTCSSRQGLIECEYCGGVEHPDEMDSHSVREETFYTCSSVGCRRGYERGLERQGLHQHSDGVWREEPEASDEQESESGVANA